MQPKPKVSELVFRVTVDWYISDSAKVADLALDTSPEIMPDFPIVHICHDEFFVCILMQGSIATVPNQFPEPFATNNATKTLDE